MAGSAAGRRKRKRQKQAGDGAATANETRDFARLGVSTNIGNVPKERTRLMISKRKAAQASGPQQHIE
jgi:hypothetical protein